MFLSQSERPCFITKPNMLEKSSCFVFWVVRCDPCSVAAEYQSFQRILRHNPKDLDLNLRQRETFKSRGKKLKICNYIRTQRHERARAVVWKANRIVTIYFELLAETKVCLKQQWKLISPTMIREGLHVCCLQNVSCQTNDCVRTYHVYV
jgi:hypothetical protein